FNADKTIPIKAFPDVYSKLLKRRSSRVFEKDKLISINLLEEVISKSLQSQKRIGEKISIYIYIKANRISGYEPGLYVFGVDSKRISLVRKNGLEEKFFSQQSLDIYKSSAFMLFFVGDKEARYSEQYLIDAGYLSGSIMWLAEEVGIGTCYIGEINQIEIKKKMHMDDDLEILTVMTGGIPDLDKSEKSEKIFELQVNRDDKPNFEIHFKDENLKIYRWSINASWEIDKDVIFVHD